MSNVRMPIQTIREGNKITKVCVEDFYKVMNRVIEAMDKAYNKSTDILDSVHKDVGDYEGELIIGTGISQPCLTDAFDEKIGNNLAFMKAKLNAGLKKRKILLRIYGEFLDLLDSIDEEIIKIDKNIQYDLEGVRKHNPFYLDHLDIYGYEIYDNNENEE